MKSTTSASNSGGTSNSAARGTAASKVIFREAAEPALAYAAFAQEASTAWLKPKSDSGGSHCNCKSFTARTTLRMYVRTHARKHARTYVRGYVRAYGTEPNGTERNLA